MQAEQLLLVLDDGTELSCCRAVIEPRSGVLAHALSVADEAAEMKRQRVVGQGQDPAQTQMPRQPASVRLATQPWSTPSSCCASLRPSRCAARSNPAGCKLTLRDAA